MSTISKALEKQRREQAREAGALPLDAPSPEQAVLRPSEEPRSQPHFRREPVRSHAEAAPRPLSPTRPATGLKVPAWTLALVLLVVAVGVGYFAGAGGGKSGGPGQLQQAALPARESGTPAPEQTPMTVRVEVAVKQETPNQPAQTQAAPPVEHVLQENPLPPAPQAPVEPAPVREAPPQDIPIEPPLDPPLIGYIPPMEDSSHEEEAPRKRRSRSSSPAPSSDGLRLEGVMWSEKDPMAIINGEIVSEGKRINGATVKKINKTTVTLEIDGHETVLQ